MNKEQVLNIIAEASEIPRALRKSDILDELLLDDTKENRNELTKIINELKDEGIIDTYYLLSYEGRKFCGRGYALAD